MAVWLSSMPPMPEEPHPPPCRRAEPGVLQRLAHQSGDLGLAGGSGVLPSSGCCAATVAATSSTCSSPAPSVGQARVAGAAGELRTASRPRPGRARPCGSPSAVGELGERRRARAPAMKRALWGSITAFVSACGVPATRTTLWQTAWCTAIPAAPDA